MSHRPILKWARSVAVAVIALGVCAPAATAAVVHLKVASIAPRAVTFRTASIRLGSVRAAWLASQGLHVRLDARRLRRVNRAAALHISVTPRISRLLERPWHGGSSGRLVLVTASAARVAVPVPAAAPPVARPAPSPPSGAPTAAPSASSARSVVACAADLSAYRAGNWPGACWRPYGDTSPFNRQIGGGAPAASGSGDIVRTLTGYGAPGNLVAGSAGTSGDWNHPTYYAQPGDPTFTLHCSADWGKCALEGMQIQIPDAAQAAGGDDGHMTVVDAASGWEYDFWQVTSKPRGGGTLTMGWGGRTRIGADGTGLGSDATAARYGNLAGVIRAPELAAGQINHALFMVVKCDSGSYVYPAMKSGHACGDGSAAPPMGAHFQLNMSDPEIDALAVPDWKKTILRAMAHYGMYVGDTGGDSWGVEFESGATYTSFGVADPTVQFAQSAGVHSYDGTHYVFSLKDGVDWSRMRVVDPCAAHGAC